MDADVVIVGGGPVGASLALLLRRSGLRAIVVDRARFPRDKPCGEGLLPAGSRVLAELGLDLAREGFPVLTGVRYRLESGASARADFRTGLGHGVRRLRLDAILAERAGVLTGVHVTAVRPGRAGVEVETSAGRLRATSVVAADGLRSPVARLLGWARPPSGKPRHGLVGHLLSDGPPTREIAVSLLGGVETYSAPAGGGEVLVAVLGPRGSLRRRGLSVEQSYREIVARAHPELAGAPLAGRVRGAGPFRVRPATVAAGGVFLAGDAAGFLDPLTGDAMAAGLVQAAALARLLAADPATAAAGYRRFVARQWRRRRVVGSLALVLTGRAALARRAVAGVTRRPGALQVLMEVNEGSRGLASIGARDWAALAGL